MEIKRTPNPLGGMDYRHVVDAAGNILSTHPSDGAAQAWIEKQEKTRCLICGRRPPTDAEGDLCNACWAWSLTFELGRNAR